MENEREQQGNNKGTTMEKLKITIIEFSRFNFVRIDRCTHYYVNGRRIRQNDYYRCYGSSDLKDKGYEYDHTDCYSDKNKDGITRDYTVMYYNRKLDNEDGF